MATNPLQSAPRRFIQKFGVAFFWALVLGLAFGSGAFFRLERRELEGEPRWHVYPRLWLEQLEARTLDWRARQLGLLEERADGVVLVNVDEDTLSNARESEHPDWAMRPWPRELLAGLAQQALREGASVVYIDEAFADVSPRQCAPCKGEDPRTDDQRFAEALRALDGKVVLGFDWARESRRSPDRPLMPVLLRVAEVPSEAQALPWVQKVILQRTVAYLVFKAGTYTVWAGSSDEQRTRALATALELKGNLTVRSLTADDDAAEVTRELLLQRLGGVVVRQFDPEHAPRAGSLDAPVPALLAPEIALASLRLIPDPDGLVRSVPLLVNSSRLDDGRGLLPGVALRARPGAAGPFTVSGGRLTWADHPGVPIDRQGFLTLKWSADEVGRGGRATMKRALPAWRLLVNREDDEEGRGVRHHDNDLAGRVVVIVDERSSPVVETPVGLMTRGAVWAQAIANVQKGEGIARVAPETDFWLTVAFAFIGSILAVAWSSLVRRPGWLAWVATLAAVVFVHALVARQLYVTQLRQVVMVAPLLACGLTFLASLGYARTLEQGLRDFVLRALGGAVRADVFRRVERDLALMRPERRELTVFFSDIEGFTSVSNEREPAVVVDVLREYLSEMTTIVLDQGGHVDKYLGDGMMAFWGAPVATPNDAESACDAALRMQARFDELRGEWEKRCGRPLLLRAGLETGDTVVGEMGTTHRVNYTVMGEPVATAARLETLAKRYGVRTLVGETLVEEAQDNFLFRPIDTVRLGREGQPIRLFELLARTTEAASFGWVKDFEQAHTAWRERRFQDAYAGFQALAQQRPDDPVIARYVTRTASFVAKPPAASWDGVYDGD